MKNRPHPRILACAGLLAALMAAGCKDKATTPQPPEVEVVTAEATDVPIIEEWVGALEGFVNAEIRAQVTGYLMSQAYKEGAQVKKGDLLFQVDPRPFQATLDQAQARLAQDQAQAGKTALDVKRYTPLAREQAISQEELDNAVQADLSAQAQVKADEAAVQSARLNLDFTRITSPVDGLAGRALGQVGNLVSTSGAILTTVSTIDPVKVFFQVPERSYLTFWKDRIDQTKSDLDLQLVLTDGSVYPLPGKLFFADRQVDPTTGTLPLAGLFPNPNYLLRPGQYGRVRARTGTRRGAILLPQRAVAELQGSYQVWVVDEQNKTHPKPVEVAEQIASHWVIRSGVKAGDHVVVEGAQKAKEGLEVSPKPYHPPTRN